MNDLAISYARFSHIGQADGDSENRQRTMFLEFCQRHGLTPAKESFIDRGLSGYSDKHRRKGDLGRLEELAKRHAFPRGTVLVVEAWDRLGRLRPDKQIELVSGLLHAGLRIGVCRLNDIFSEQDFGTHKWTTLAVLAQLAHEESKQKSDRIGSSWRSRKQQARRTGELVTTLVPGWLRVVNGHMVAIPERVAVVKRIFYLAGHGYGIKRILNELAQENVPPFGRAKRWSSTYIRKLLTSEQVLGKFQPKRLEEQSDGTRKSVPDGFPIGSYYPQVIDQAEFDLARLGTGKRKGRSGPRQRRFINVFQGLLRNALLDGDTFLLANKGHAKKPHLYLINDAGNNSGYKQTRFSYPVFERAILRLLREVPTSVVAPSEPPLVVDTLQMRFDAIKADLESLKADIRKKYSSTLTALVVEKEEEQAQVKEQLDRASAEAQHPLEDAWQEAGDLIQAIEQAADAEDAKLRLRVALQRAIDHMTLLVLRRGIASACFVDVRFKSGAQRVYIIWHHPPHRSGNSVRDGFWWATSGVLVGTTYCDLSDPDEQAHTAEFVRMWQDDGDRTPRVGKGWLAEVIPAERGDKE